MVNVPYEPYSTVTPQSGGEKVSVSTPGAAFGENIGTAVQQLGGTLDKVGDEMFQRALALQALTNETNARKAQSDYAEQSGLLQAKYDSLEGKAKVDGLQQHIKDLKDLRTNIRNSLGTANAQQMYDGDTLPFMQRNIFSAASGAGQAQKQWVLGTAENTRRVITDTWVDPKSDSEFNDKATQLSRADDTINGVKQDGLDDSRKQASLSALWAGRINQLAKTDWDAAQKMLDGLPKGTLTQADYDKVFDHVQSQGHAVGSRVGADAVLAPLTHGDPTAKRPDQPLQYWLDQGDKWADEHAPNDPTMKDYVRARVAQGFRSHMSAVNDFRAQNLNTIDGALIGAEGGKIPTSPEDLNALGPKYQAAYNNLDDAAKLAVNKKMATIAKGDVGWTTDNLRLVQKLKGMAVDDPASFLDQDVVSMPLPMSARRELVTMQANVLKQGNADPRIPRALQMLNLPQSLLQDKDEKQLFIGALSDQLRDFQEEHKRPPNRDEMQQIGATLLQDQVTQKHWYGDTHGPLYNLPIPQEDVDEQREKLKQKTGIDYPDETIRRELIRERYRSLAPKSSSGSIVGSGGEQIIGGGPNIPMSQ